MMDWGRPPQLDAALAATEMRYAYNVTRFLMDRNQFATFFNPDLPADKKLSHLFLWAHYFIAVIALSLLVILPGLSPFSAFAFLKPMVFFITISFFFMEAINTNNFIRHWRQSACFWKAIIFTLRDIVIALPFYVSLIPLFLKGVWYAANEIFSFISTVKESKLGGFNRVRYFENTLMFNLFGFKKGFPLNGLIAITGLTSFLIGAFFMTSVGPVVLILYLFACISFLTGMRAYNVFTDRYGNLKGTNFLRFFTELFPIIWMTATYSFQALLARLQDTLLNRIKIPWYMWRLKNKKSIPANAAAVQALSQLIDSFKPLTTQLNDLAKGSEVNPEEFMKSLGGSSPVVSAVLLQILETKKDNPLAQQLIKALNEKDKEKCLAIVKSICATKDSQLIDPIVKAINEFITSLHKFSIQPFLEGLNDAKEDVRLPAVVGLGKLQYANDDAGRAEKEQVIEALITRANDKSKPVYDAVIKSLQALGANILQQSQAHLNGLKSENADVRTVAAQALGQLTEPLKPLIRQLSDLVKGSEVKPEDFMKTLGGLTPALCAVLLQILEANKDNQLAQQLINAIKEKDNDKRLAVAKAICATKDSQLITLIVKDINDFMTNLHKSLIQPLLNILSDKYEDVRLAAAQGLGKLNYANNPEEKAKAIKALTTKATDINALRKAANRTDDREIEALLASLNSSEEPVRLAAAKALSKLNYADDTKEKVIGALRQRIKDEEKESVRAAAAQTLVDIKADKILPVRLASTKVLGDIKDASATETLLTLFENPEENSFIRLA
ncbi:MAG: HEAT repeat domain-containing protein, partial [Candidatus Omnitrophica bacterium]|nr:HEAT repeat domain-containing protein [Candidatus Omnitrophota bacterium]